MGTWSLPKTVLKAESLAEIMSSPVTARTACDILYHVIGDDNLFDNLDAAESIDAAADVRGVVVSSLAEIYFTGSDALAFASTEALSIIRSIVEQFVASADDIYFKISRIEDEADARSAVGEHFELPTCDVDRWEIRRDSTGLDFVVTEPGEGRTYRLVAAGGFLMEVCDENLDFASRPGGATISG